MKREATISIVLACGVIGVGAQVEWLANSGEVVLALGCVGLVFLFSLGCFACCGNAVRLFRIAREERIWEQREESYSTDGIDLEPTQRADAKEGTR